MKEDKDLGVVGFIIIGLIFFLGIFIIVDWCSFVDVICRDKTPRTNGEYNLIFFCCPCYIIAKIFNCLFPTNQQIISNQGSLPPAEGNPVFIVVGIPVSVMEPPVLQEV
jgi:hypothetical protein